MTIKEILEYVSDEYGISEEYPFRDSSHSVLRVRGSSKWFALLSEVPGHYLGLNDDELHEIVNLKNYPFEILALLDVNGIHPAWHMNKKHWLTVDLSVVSDPGMVFDLLDQSYRIVAGKKHI